MNMTERETSTIDEEWLKLILEAKEIGLSIEEIRDFLNQSVAGEHLICT
jgi:DNA-binding transcriptional MerR regulator